MKWHKVNSWAIESECGWYSIQRLHYRSGIRYRLFKGLACMGEFKTADEAKENASELRNDE